MTKTSNILQLFAAVVIAVSLVPVSHAQIVYNNSVNDQNVRFNPGTNEVGDEITLGLGGRNLTLFEFQYWGTNFSGDEEVRLKFYLNDGDPSPQGALMPETVLFESLWFPINETPRFTLNYTVFSGAADATVDLTVPLPDNFTWSVQFRNLGGTAAAGVDLYSPPVTGGSFDDYWDNTGSGWELRTNSTTPIDFAARVTTVPEPTTLWLAILGGLALLGVRLRYSRS